MGEVGECVGECVWLNFHLVTQMASLSDIVAMIKRLSDCGHVWETVDRSGRLCEGWGYSGKVGKIVGRWARLWKDRQDCQGDGTLSGGMGMLSRGRDIVRGGRNIAKGIGTLSGDGDVPRSQSDA